MFASCRVWLFTVCVYNSNKASLILYRLWSRYTFNTLCFGVILGPWLMPWFWVWTCAVNIRKAKNKSARLIGLWCYDKKSNCLMLPALLACNKRKPLKLKSLNTGIWRSSHVSFFLVVVNCMRAWVHCHALPYALATHLHPCTSSSPAGLLLVRAALICACTHLHKCFIYISPKLGLCWFLSFRAVWFMIDLWFMCFRHFF